MFILSGKTGEVTGALHLWPKMRQSGITGQEPKMTDETQIKTISLFPLPSSVFYPKTFLPLHIFEPRYREMTGNSIDNDQWIGMVLLAPGYEDTYHGAPPIQQMGCAGNIDRCFRYDDGKYDIVLKGQSRFRIIKEVGDASFRQAEVELLQDTNDDLLQNNPPLYDKLKQVYGRYIDHLPDSNMHKMEIDFADCNTVGQAVDRVAYIFDSPVDQQQHFLEELDVAKRVEMIADLLQLKLDILQRSKTVNQNDWDVRMN